MMGVGGGGEMRNIQYDRKRDSPQKSYRVQSAETYRLST